MTRQILSHKHPVDGLIEIFRGPQSPVKLFCRWPLDLDTDEWMDVRDTFSPANYSAAVEEAAATGHGAATGERGGSIAFDVLESREAVMLEIGDSGNGWASKGLRLRINRPLEDFAS
jgi:hypothetical protein